MTRWTLAGCMALGALGCGGGGGGTTTPLPPTPVTVTLTGTSALQGYVSGGFVTFDDGVVVGDYQNAQGPQGGVRGFVSFDLNAAGIPTGATVQLATLTLVQWQVSSFPYATLGSILVDQVVYGNVLEAGAYSRSFPTSQGFATLSGDTTLGPKTVTVTAQVQADLDNLRTRSQFRLRFPVENDLDANNDFARFWGTSNAPLPSERPTLVVTYLP